MTVLVKKPTRADILDFQGWLVGKQGEYDPQNRTNCLVCQYLKDRGIPHPTFSGPDVVRYSHGEDDHVGVRLPKAIAEIAYGKNNLDLNKGCIVFTFEAARKRAEKVLKAMA